jgi:hypothetical protein
MSVYLVSQSGHKAALSEGAVRVGCDVRAELQINPELGLARLHYEILPVAHGYLIRKLDTHLPLLVNGREITTAVLKHGDVVSAGKLHLTFQKESDQAATAANPNEKAAIAKTSLLFAPTSKPLAGELFSLNIDGSDSMHDVDPKKNNLGIPEPDLLQPYKAPEYSRLDLLKEAQNFRAAFVASCFSLIFGIFIYSSLCSLPWPYFLITVSALGYAIGWIIKCIGSGLETRFGYLASGTTMATVVMVNLLAQGGFITLYTEKDSSLPAKLAAAREYSQEAKEQATSRQVQENLPQDSSLNATAESLALSQKTHEKTSQLHQDAKAAALSQSQSAMNNLQALNESDFMLALRSLAACLIMAIIAYKVSFRTLSKKEMSELARPL